jgi:hypothetical protein
MNLRRALKKFRLQPLSAEAQKVVDATEDASSIGIGGGGAMAPTNWVPSQQDERPH